MPSGLEYGALGLAISDGVTSPPLVDPDRTRTAGRTNPRRRYYPVKAQSGRWDSRKRPSETLEDRPRRLGAERERDLEDRFPALKACCIDLSQNLDVHQLVTDFDVVAAWRQKIELDAFLDRLRGHRFDRRVGMREAMGEGAPFPARDYLGHALSLLRALPNPNRHCRSSRSGRVMDTSNDRMTAGSAGCCRKTSNNLLCSCTAPRSLIACSTGMVNCSPMCRNAFWINTAICRSLCSRNSKYGRRSSGSRAACSSNSLSARLLSPGCRPASSYAVRASETKSSADRSAAGLMAAIARSAATTCVAMLC